MSTKSSAVKMLMVASLTFFVLSGILLGLLIWKSDKLTAYGLTEHVYYFALVPLGLSASAFLFGVLRSSARWKGTFLGGVLKLGGPVVLFCLIMIGGLYLIQNVSTFPITVYVHGEGGPQEIPLRNSGTVVLRLGLEPRIQPIGAEGQAFFPAIPPSFRNQSVPVWVEADTYEAVGDTHHQLSGPAVDVTVHRKSGRISGRIEEDEETFMPIPGAEIRIEGIVTKAGPGGEFEITVPGEHMQSELDMDVSAAGHKPVHTTILPNSNPAVIKLARAH